MTHTHSSSTDTRQIPIGAKLQTAREILNLDRKDAAAQLRLNENIIDMIENNSFPDDMPPLFIRGYIRSYGKLLQIPEDDITAAIAPIKTKPAAPEIIPQQPAPAAPIATFDSRKYLMPLLTGGIVVLSLWLVAAWWHSRPSLPAKQHPAIDTPITAGAPAGVSVQLAKPVAVTAELPAPSEPTLLPSEPEDL